MLVFIPIRFIVFFERFFDCYEETLLLIVDYVIVYLAICQVVQLIYT